VHLSPLMSFIEFPSVPLNDCRRHHALRFAIAPGCMCGVTDLVVTLPLLRPAGAYYNDQHPGGNWLTALVAAAVPLRQLRLRDGTVVPGELVAAPPPGCVSVLCLACCLPWMS
jgi:hypothetical protein